MARTWLARVHSRMYTDHVRAASTVAGSTLARPSLRGTWYAAVSPTTADEVERGAGDDQDALGSVEAARRLDGEADTEQRRPEQRDHEERRGRGPVDRLHGADRLDGSEPVEGRHDERGEGGEGAADGCGPDDGGGGQGGAGGEHGGSPRSGGLPGRSDHPTPDRCDEPWVKGAEPCVSV